MTHLPLEIVKKKNQQGIRYIFVLEILTSE